jgi:peptidoglycan/xylan/chitin deacetylase (PgdA/CDA1 family)
MSDTLNPPPIENAAPKEAAIASSPLKSVPNPPWVKSNRRWASRAAGLLVLAAMAAGYVVWQRPGDELAAQVSNYVRTRQKVVALTFDDGPHPLTTALLLDTLRRHHARATFFVVGTKAREAPGLLRRMIADGDEVENHTYTHDNLDHLSSGEILKEVQYADRDIEAVTGSRPKFVRPPGGEYDIRSVSVFSKLKRTFGLWSVNPGDWEKPPPGRIIRDVLRQVRPGTIVLLHDDALNTVEALPRILEGLRREGYRFVTVNDLETM